MNPGTGYEISGPLGTSYVLQLQTLAEGSDGTYKVKQNTAELKALSVVGQKPRMPEVKSSTRY